MSALKGYTFPMPGGVVYHHGYAAQETLLRAQEKWRKGAQERQYIEEEKAAAELYRAQEAYAKARAGEKAAAATALYVAQEKYAAARAGEKEAFAGARYGEFRETEARAGKRYGEAVGTWGERYAAGMKEAGAGITALGELGETYAPGGVYGEAAITAAEAARRKSVAAARATGVMTGVAPGYGTLARAEFEKRGVLEAAEERRKTRYADIMKQYAAARLQRAQLGVAAQPPIYGAYK